MNDTVESEIRKAFEEEGTTRCMVFLINHDVLKGLEGTQCLVKLLYTRDLKDVHLFLRGQNIGGVEGALLLSQCTRISYLQYTPYKARYEGVMLRALAKGNYAFGLYNCKFTEIRTRAVIEDTRISALTLDCDAIEFGTLLWLFEHSRKLQSLRFIDVQVLNISTGLAKMRTKDSEPRELYTPKCVSMQANGDILPLVLLSTNLRELFINRSYEAGSCLFEERCPPNLVALKIREWRYNPIKIVPQLVCITSLRVLSIVATSDEDVEVIAKHCTQLRALKLQLGHIDRDVNVYTSLSKLSFLSELHLTIFSDSMGAQETLMVPNLLSLGMVRKREVPEHLKGLQKRAKEQADTRKRARTEFLRLIYELLRMENCRVSKDLVFSIVTKQGGGGRMGWTEEEVFSCALMLMYEKSAELLRVKLEEIELYQEGSYVFDGQVFVPKEPPKFGVRLIEG